MKVRFLAWSGDYGVFSVTWSDRSGFNALSVNVQIKADTASLRDGADIPQSLQLEAIHRAQRTARAFADAFYG